MNAWLLLTLLALAGVSNLILFLVVWRLRRISQRQPEMRRLPWLLAVAMSWILALGALGTALHSWSFIRSATTTQGRVIALKERLSQENDSKTYSPTFEFQDAAGQPHVVESSFASNPPAHEVGEVVPVLYRPGDPSAARIDRARYHWFAPGVLGALSVASGVFGLVLQRQLR